MYVYSHSMPKDETPQPPPSFGGSYVSMLEVEEESEPTPAHYVNAFRRRGELDQGDPSDEETGTHLPSLVRKYWGKTVRLGRWLVTDPKLIRDPTYANHTANQLMAEGFRIEDIATQLEIEELDDWFHSSLNLTTPLTRTQWEYLIEDYGLRYPDLYARFELSNLPQYIEAGIGPAVLLQMDVSFDTLMSDSRVDAQRLQLFDFKDWSKLGMSALHLGRLGPSAMDVFTIRQWRSVGMTVPMLDTVGLDVEALAERKGLSVDRVLAALVAEGEYELGAVVPGSVFDVRVSRSHNHMVWLDENGRGYTEEIEGHSHEVVDGVVQLAAGHVHEIVRCAQ